MDMTKIGRYAFLAGLVISVLVGILPAAGMPLGDAGIIGIILVVLGVIVGILNVTNQEVQPFLLGTVALIVVGIGLGGVLASITVVASILSAFVAFVAGAALIVALKEVYAITSTK